MEQHRNKIGGTRENQRSSTTSHHRIRRTRWGMIAYFTLGSAVVIVTQLQTFAPQLHNRCCSCGAKQPTYVSQSYQQGPMAGPQSLPTVQPTQQYSRLHELARDTFRRADQQTWGVASDQQVWQGDADNATRFAIRSGAGEIGGGQGKVTALLGSISVNADVLFSASSTFSQRESKSYRSLPSMIEYVYPMRVSFWALLSTPSRFTSRQLPRSVPYRLPILSLAHTELGACHLSTCGLQVSQLDTRNVDASADFGTTGGKGAKESHPPARKG